MPATNGNPTFSILLPTHNRGDVIGYAISSILAQTYKNFELLVVGDGCTDQTEEVVKRLRQKDKRVKWYPFPKGKGFGYDNRNTIVRDARGAYIAYMGHDDIWLPNHLERAFGFFKSHTTYRIVYSRPLWVTDKGLVLPSFFNTNAASIRDVFMHDHNEIPAVCFVYRRQATATTGLWQENIPQAGDWDLWKRILATDPEQKLGFIPTPTTLTFRSAWRKKSSYLNEHLEGVYNAILSSPVVHHKMQIPGAQQHPIQKWAWDALQNKKWQKKLESDLQNAQDEVTYKLTLENHTLTRDRTRIIRLIHRLKRTKVYSLFHKLQKRKARKKQRTPS